MTIEELDPVLTGDIPWTAAVNANGWANYGSGQAPLRYMRKNGIVYVEGTVVQGTLGAAAFTLPVGCRPNAGIIASCIGGNNGVARVDINAVGTVVPQAATSGVNFMFCFPADV